MILGMVWIRERATGVYSPMNPNTGLVITGVMVNVLPPNAVFGGEFEFDETGKVKLLSGQENNGNEDLVICPNCLSELPNSERGCVSCRRCGWASCEI